MTEPPLRLLMLIPHLGMGGAQGAFLRLAAHLGAHAQVTIAVMQGDPSDAGGFPTVQLDRFGGGKLRRWWGMLRRLKALKRDHDVTISFLSGMNLLNALAGPRHRTIVSERGSKRHDIGMSPVRRLIWTRLLDPLTYWRAGRVVAASRGLAHEIVSANPWAAPRVLAIEGLVDAAALLDAADLPPEPGLGPLGDCETVVAFGRLHVQKGYDLLIDAFAQVRQGRPAARLLLIGSGPEEDHLRARAAGLGLTVAHDAAGPAAPADVVMPSPLRAPLRHLSLGRVFALPSRYEGLPNSLIEALAAGAPVLAADCPWGPRAILSDGTLPEGTELPSLPMALPHGVLMPVPGTAGAVDAWAREIDRALDAGPPSRRPRAARLEAISRYDIARTGPVWLRLVVHDMASHGPQRRLRRPAGHPT